MGLSRLFLAALACFAFAAQAQNLPLTATSKEYAPGQFEANLRHLADARLAADHVVFLKQVVKAAARATGFEATFMAKPYPNRSGSGLHVHVSVLDEKGRNIFDDGTREGSDALRHAIRDHGCRSRRAPCARSHSASMRGRGASSATGSTALR